MSGKGSKQRPTNLEEFHANYDAIFKQENKPEQVLTEVVRFNEDNNLYEVDQLPKNLINE
jgi:hypothetical protein